jgi:hypothetical protein
MEAPERMKKNKINAQEVDCMCEHVCGEFFNLTDALSELLPFSTSC